MLEALLIRKSQRVINLTADLRRFQRVHHFIAALLPFRETHHELVVDMPPLRKRLRKNHAVADAGRADELAVDLGVSSDGLQSLAIVQLHKTVSDLADLYLLSLLQMPTPEGLQRGPIRRAPEGG